MGLIERRIGLLFVVFIGLLGLGAIRATWLGAVRSGTLQRAAATQQATTATVPSPRGTITDRNGQELAVSQPAADVTANPRIVRHPAEAARRLAPLLGTDANAVLALLANRDRGFVYLARLLDGGRAERIQRLRIAGIDLVPEVRRTYPRAWLASQLLGTVGTDGRGLSGLEESQNAALRGRDGRRRVINDALGQPISMRDVEPTQPGRTVELTLDARIQDEVEQVLEGVGRTYRPKGATALVMDPRSGELLALANWPRVDANDIAAAPAYARQNRAVAQIYEPGSTFKAFTVAGALEDGRVTPGTPFELPVNIQVADRSIHDAEERGPETRTVAQILAQSSNVGAIEIGQRLGARRFDYWVRRFGFGTTSGVDLPGEEQGIVLPYGKYSGSSMGNLPIGQGESVTPIQMASAYAAIANGGVLRPARVVRAVDGRPVAPPRGGRVISAATAEVLRRMLEGVLAPGGTAHEAAIPGYDLAGKTGTASKPDPGGGYSSSRYVASFVGFAPANDPRLLVTVMVDEPQGAIYGGVVAAPAFQKIVAFALPYLGIAPK